LDENTLANHVIAAAIEVHKSVGPGLLESAYQLCLAHELKVRAISFVRERSIAVHYKGLLVDNAYRVDFVVEDKLLLELKTVDLVTPTHKAQLLTYLRLTEIKLGLLLNFNMVLLKNGIHRVVNNL